MVIPEPGHVYRLKSGPQLLRPTDDLVGGRGGFLISKRGLIPSFAGGVSEGWKEIPRAALLPEPKHLGW